MKINKSVYHSFSRHAGFIVPEDYYAEKAAAKAASEERAASEKAVGAGVPAKDASVLREILAVSSGTLATLFHSRESAELDRALAAWVLRVAEWLNEGAMTGNETWQEAFEKFRPTIQIRKGDPS